MADLKLGESLCGDVARLALHVGQGKYVNPGMLAIALRAALLLDLAAFGAIDAPVARDGVAIDAGPLRRSTLSIDVSPTGCPPADELLRYVARYPGRSIDHVLRRGRPHLKAVTEQLVRDGIWIRRRRLASQRYEDMAAARFESIRWRVPNLLRGRVEPTGEREAALAAIADVLGLCRVRDIDDQASSLMVSRLGSTAWLGRDIVEYLRRTRISREMSATPWQVSDG